MERDQERVARVASALEAEGLNAFVCSLPENVFMLAGYWPGVGNAIAIATREGAIGVVAPEDEIEYARASWADCVLTFRPASLHRNESMSDAVRDPLRDLASALGVNGRPKIAFDGAASFDPCGYASVFVYGPGMPSLLRYGLPSGTVAPAGAVLDKLRSVLTKREISSVRRACAVAGNAFAAVARQLGSGMSELEVASLLRSRLSIGDRWDGFAYCMSGPNSARAYAAYQQSTDRRLAEGDLVLVHCNSYHGGFWTDITRTFVIGSMEQRHRRVFDAVAAATKAAFSAVQPGARACAVGWAAREVMADSGFATEFRHATGHGVGFAATTTSIPESTPHHRTRSSPGSSSTSNRPLTSTESAACGIATWLWSQKRRANV